jgi:hypothetical protein
MSKGVKKSAQKSSKNRKDMRPQSAQKSSNNI